MLRILHLLDPHDGIEPMLACRAAMSIGEASHALWLVTDSAGERVAADFGLTTSDRVGTILGRAESAGRGMRSLLEHRTDDLGEPTPDLVQCWSVRMLGAARAAFGKRIISRCGVLVRPPSSATLRRAEAARFSKTPEERALDDTTLLTLDMTSREQWAPMASAGRGAMRMRDNIRLAPAPPLPPTECAVGSPSRAAVREALGLDDGDIAVVLLADPPEAGDAMRFTFQVGLQHVGGVRITGIVPRGASHSRRGARFVAGHGRRWGMIDSARSLEQVLIGADIAVWDVADSGEVSSGPALLAACIAAGVPVAAAPHEISLGALAAIPDCLSRDGSTRAVASRMFDFARDASVRATVSRRMLDHAAELRERDGFRRTLLALWRERANVPIIRPGLPVPAALMGAPS
jgi:hypothetical protein